MVIKKLFIRVSFKVSAKIDALSLPDFQTCINDYKFYLKGK